MLQSYATVAATSLPQLSRALGRCRRLVGHFNHSVNSNRILKKKLQYKTLSLIQDVQTRWNSTYYMAERINTEGELMPTDAEFTALELYYKVMKPLVDSETIATHAIKYLLRLIIRGIRT